MYAHVELRVYRAVRLGSSLILALLLIASLQPSFAQLSTGTITGVVRDTTGAIVPNASAVLKNVETTVERRTVTNNAGNYSFTNVTPGRYTMQISGTGFRVNQVAEFVQQVKTGRAARRRSSPTTDCQPQDNSACANPTPASPPRPQPLPCPSPSSRPRET